MSLIESALRRPAAGCLACAGGLVVLVVFAYYVAPLERLDASVLSSLNAPSGSLAHDLASLVERLVLPLSQTAAAALACLLGLGLGRPREALVAVALVAGTALIVEALKVALSNPRYQLVHGHAPIGLTVFPSPNSFPSGNSAGALSIALAFLFVAPGSWQRPIVAVGIGFTLAVSAGLLVLNYHYPSDVLGGWLVAAGWCLALFALGIADDRCLEAGRGSGQ
jgi:membrane-associated phospholipid phosphatase